MRQETRDERSRPTGEPTRPAPAAGAGAHGSSARALVCGWPSVPGGEATAGDLLTMEEVAAVLSRRGLAVDVGTNLGMPWGVDATTADPDAYDHVVFACGPLDAEGAALAERFARANRVAVNVSVVDEAAAARFHTVIPRDGDGERNPDLTLGRRPADVPVIGVVRAHPQPEYPAADHERVHEQVRLALASRDGAAVDFDTRVHPAADPLAAHARSSAAVSALAARMDLVVSTRLHGAVLALARGVPVVAIDPVRGGAKVAAQMAALDWPCVATAEEVTAEQLAQAIEWCLGPHARDRARAVAGDVADDLADVRERLVAAVAPDAP